eukprot:TRINITY_DN10077_c0_g1_i2.p1 TRINITY_DN10077_c0_g1~~TRINITY_DN10077_c0_g1_i2.p1  ORF type:complete len:1401 (+),score=212.30 TRINITY_DN10077_c0_g1_i2:80-4204(+)
MVHPLLRLCQCGGKDRPRPRDGPAPDPAPAPPPLGRARGGHAPPGATPRQFYAARDALCRGEDQGRAGIEQRHRDRLMELLVFFAHHRPAPAAAAPPPCPRQLLSPAPDWQGLFTEFFQRYCPDRLQDRGFFASIRGNEEQEWARLLSLHGMSEDNWRPESAAEGPSRFQAGVRSPGGVQHVEGGEIVSLSGVGDGPHALRSPTAPGAASAEGSSRARRPQPGQQQQLRGGVSGAELQAALRHLAPAAARRPARRWLVTALMGLNKAVLCGGRRDVRRRELDYVVLWLRPPFYDGARPAHLIGASVGSPPAVVSPVSMPQRRGRPAAADDQDGARASSADFTVSDSSLGNSLANRPLHFDDADRDRMLLQRGDPVRRTASAMAVSEVSDETLAASHGALSQGWRGAEFAARPGERSTPGEARRGGGSPAITSTSFGSGAAALARDRASSVGNRFAPATPALGGRAAAESPPQPAAMAAVPRVCSPDGRWEAHVPPAAPRSPNPGELPGDEEIFLITSSTSRSRPRESTQRGSQERSPQPLVTPSNQHEPQTLQALSRQDTEGGMESVAPALSSNSIAPVLFSSRSGAPDLGASFHSQGTSPADRDRVAACPQNPETPWGRNTRRTPADIASATRLSDDDNPLGHTHGNSFAVSDTPANYVISPPTCTPADDAGQRELRDVCPVDPRAAAAACAPAAPTAPTPQPEPAALPPPPAAAAHAISLRKVPVKSFDGAWWKGDGRTRWLASDAGKGRAVATEKADERGAWVLEAADGGVHVREASTGLFLCVDPSARRDGISVWVVLRPTSSQGALWDWLLADGSGTRRLLTNSSTADGKQRHLAVCHFNDDDKKDAASQWVTAHEWCNDMCIWEADDPPAGWQAAPAPAWQPQQLSRLSDPSAERHHESSSPCASSPAEHTVTYATEGTPRSSARGPLPPQLPLPLGAVADRTAQGAHGGAEPGSTAGWSAFSEVKGRSHSAEYPRPADFGHALHRPTPRRASLTQEPPSRRESDASRGGSSAAEFRLQSQDCMHQYSLAKVETAVSSLPWGSRGRSCASVSAPQPRRRPVDICAQTPRAELDFVRVQTEGTVAQLGATAPAGLHSVPNTARSRRSAKPSPRPSSDGPPSPETLLAMVNAGDAVGAELPPRPGWTYGHSEEGTSAWNTPRCPPATSLPPAQRLGSVGSLPGNRQTESPPPRVSASFDAITQTSPGQFPDPPQPASPQARPRGRFAVGPAQRARRGSAHAPPQPSASQPQGAEPPRQTRNPSRSPSGRERVTSRSPSHADRRSKSPNRPLRSKSPQFARNPIPLPAPAPAPSGAPSAPKGHPAARHGTGDRPQAQTARVRGARGAVSGEHAVATRAPRAKPGQRAVHRP